METTPLTPAERVAQLIKELEITPYQFGKATGISHQTLSNVLTGKNKPGLDTLQAIADVYPAAAIFLLTGKGDAFPDGRYNEKPVTKSDATTATAPPPVEPDPAGGGLRKHQPTYEELAAENAYLHKANEELRTDKGQLWQQNAQLIELGKTDASSDAAAPVDSFAWLAPKPHRQVNGLVRYDQPETTCAHYDLATGLRVEQMQVAKAA